MKTRIAAALGLALVCAFASTLVSSQPASEGVSFKLERAVHVVTPDGKDAVLEPGTYTARARDTKSIEVKSSGGKATVVQAVSGMHLEPVSAPQALTVASGDDVVHIVLLMPGGTTLDAVGSASGVRTRGGTFAPLPPQQFANIIAMQPQLGTGPVPAPAIGQLPPQFQTERRLPVPAQKPEPSLFAGPCLGSDGKPLPADRFVSVNFAARATGPFSVELTWTGPAAQYDISNGVNDTIRPDAQLQAPGSAPGTAVAPPGARPPSGALGSFGQPTVRPYLYRHERPVHPVLPDFAYNYVLKATLPDGKLVCQGASARTAPAAITPLQSVFVNPSEVRIGFVRPPNASEVNIYRVNYVEDGRQPPFNKRLLQEVQAAASNIRPVNPGQPPLPQDYNRPLAYDFIVEAVWRNGSQSSAAQLPIRVDGPTPLLGWADLHTHPMSHLAFGSKIFHGAPDIGSLLPALSIPRFNDIDPRFQCEVVPGRRAANIGQAMADDSPTHGDTFQSVCGDGLRKAAILAIEAGNDADMPQPGRRLGAPVFDAWPVWHDVTHQKMWVDWIRRAYQGGLRVMVALSHNNRVLAEVTKGQCNDPAHPCWIPIDDRMSSDLQIDEIKRFAGRHSDFMEVALTSADLYRIVRGDPSRNIPPKLAVVLGVEIDNIGNFCQGPPTSSPNFGGYLCRNSRPSPADITNELTRLYSQGVRYIFPVHVVDNAFGGTAPYNALFDAANLMETGSFWDVECAGTAPYADDEIGFKTPNVTIIDELYAAIPSPFNNVIPRGIPVPKAPACTSGHRNKKALNRTTFANPPPGRSGIGIGEYAVKEMMRLGMIVDIDHMSHRTAEDVLSIAEGVPGGGYPLMSGHSGVRGYRPPNSLANEASHFNAENSRTRSQLDRIGCLGGMFGLGTDHAEPRTWAIQYQDALNAIRVRSSRCPSKELGLGAVALGTDTNSLVKGPKPLLEGSDMTDRQLNVYGVKLNNTPRFPEGPSSTLAKTWDLRVDGVAHYGMFADFVKAVWSFPFERTRGMNVSGQTLVEGHLDRSADNFWRMWVKVEAQKNSIH